MTLALRIALAILASYRTAQLITIDDGPGRVFLHLRENAGAYDYDETGRVKTSLGQLTGCPYCLGLYTSIVMAVLALFPSMVGDLILLALGISGGQAYLQGPRDTNS